MTKRSQQPADYQFLSTEYKFLKREVDWYNRRIAELESDKREVALRMASGAYPLEAVGDVLRVAEKYYSFLVKREDDCGCPG